MINKSQYQNREVLAYTPIGLELEERTGWGTFLFTSSRACNLSCEGCWTSATNELIRKQLKVGTDWLYDGSYGVNALEAMLKKFAIEGGQLVANMSDGEPLIPANYSFISELAKECGKQDLPLLLFTNGIHLDEGKLIELDEATKGRISYSISMQTGIPERYGNFTLSDRGPNHTGEKLFGKLEEKLDVWKKYDEQTKVRTGKHAIAIHTYVIPEKTIEEDLEALKEITERLGNIPWIVSTMGAHVSESMAGRTVDFSPEATELVKKYHTGPTATLSFGEGKDQKLCSYISHGFHPFEQEQGVFGITFNPYQKGQVQTCPYHSAIGTSEWFNLRDYLDSMKQNGQQITDKHIGTWLENAVKAETMVTQAAFDLVGYEHCLMRHSRKPEIDLLISGINIEMVKRKKVRKFGVQDREYFNKMMENLKEAIQIVTTKERTDMNRSAPLKIKRIPGKKDKNS